MREMLAVGAGGALGSVGRWLIGLALSSVVPGVPAGTFAANVIAGFIIGATNGAAAALGMSQEIKLLLTVGLCGGLSTFSTFSNETFKLLEMGNTMGAVLNILINVATCLAAVALGYKLVG